MLVADRTDMGRLFQAIGPAVANACLSKFVISYLKTLYLQCISTFFVKYKDKQSIQSYKVKDENSKMLKTTDDNRIFSNMADKPRI